MRSEADRRPHVEGQCCQLVCSLADPLILQERGMRGRLTQVPGIATTIQRGSLTWYSIVLLSKYTTIRVK